MLSCWAAWVTWPAIASAWRCASAPSVSASSAVNFLPLGLLVAQVLDEGSRSSELLLGLLGLLGVLGRDQRLDLVVGQDQALEDVGDVREARGGDEAELGRRSRRR